MAAKILQFFETIVKPTFTQSSVANGAGRICSVIDNTSIRAEKAHCWWKIKTGGSAPTAGSAFRLHLIPRSNDGTSDLVGGETSAQTLGTSDAAVSTEPVNVESITSITVTTATAATYTARGIARDLAPKNGAAMWNATGQTDDTTAGNFDLQWMAVNPESQ